MSSQEVGFIHNNRLIVAKIVGTHNHSVLRMQLFSSSTDAGMPDMQFDLSMEVS
jgi:hypothetical protein